MLLVRLCLSFKQQHCSLLRFPLMLQFVESVMRACLVSTFLSACLETLEGLVFMYFSDASSFTYYLLDLF